MKKNIKCIEVKWQKKWEKNNSNKWIKDIKYSYFIDTPPPTISGMLHMGHIFSYTQTDFFA